MPMPRARTSRHHSQLTAIEKEEIMNQNHRGFVPLLLAACCAATACGSQSVDGQTAELAKSQSAAAGDGNTDILWHNGVTGETQHWYMHVASGVATRLSFPSLSSTLNVPDSSGWKPVAEQDFNGDGNADILWHNGTSGATQLWYMADAVNRASIGDFSPALNLADNTNWRVAGTGDFNADGKTDILWHNVVTGQMQAWFMNGHVRLNFGNLVGLGGGALPTMTQAAGWRVAAVNDFDGNSGSDVVWHNGTSGVTRVWFMTGVGLSGIADLDPSLNLADSTGWRIMNLADADYNFDGMPDLLWHNGTTGVTQIWLMNGTVRTSFVNLPASLNLPDSSNWRIVHPY
jgi:hypothetical protein